MFGSKKKKAAEKAELVEQITENVVAKVEANEVTIYRKGLFTPEQEELLDKLYANGGFIDTIDGMIIKVIDNTVLERLKNKLPKEYLPTLYQVIDEIMEALKTNLNKE